MTTLAAIDAGSNAMRLVIGRAGRNGGVEVVKNSREAVRMGKDVFAGGRMSRRLIKAAAAAFGRFHETIDEWGVEHTVAVGTSALREAENRTDLLDLVREKTGIEVNVIGGLEEARLVHLAVSRKIDISEGEAVLVDVGGGSVEVTLTSGGGADREPDAEGGDGADASGAERPGAWLLGLHDADRGDQERDAGLDDGRAGPPSCRAARGDGRGTSRASPI